MRHLWKASPYKYADGVPWNDDRYEICVRVGGQWIPVGGAIRHWSGRAVAFLCSKTAQRLIRTPADAAVNSDGHYVMGNTLQETLEALKVAYPDPVLVLREQEELAAAAF